MKKRRWRRYLGGGIGAFLLALGVGGLAGPAWLSPHAPLNGAEALVVEGFWGDSLMAAAAAYLQAHPGQRVFVTGGTRESLSWQTRVPGLLRWTFGPQAAGAPQPVVRLKGHSQSCNGQEASWQVWVNDSLRFAGVMPNYQAREWTYILPPGPESLQQVAISLEHPAPDTTCAWVIWYLWAHNMQTAQPQQLVFIPADSSLPPQPMPTTFGGIGRARLISLGVDSLRIEALPSPYAGDQRTFAAAQGLASHLRQQHPPLRRVNLLGGGYHARRSWEAYRLALRATGVEVGVLRLQPAGTGHWWQQAGHRQAFLEQAQKYLAWTLWRIGVWLGVVDP